VVSVRHSPHGNLHADISTSRNSSRLSRAARCRAPGPSFAREGKLHVCFRDRSLLQAASVQPCLLELPEHRRQREGTRSSHMVPRRSGQSFVTFTCAGAKISRGLPQKNGGPDVLERLTLLRSGAQTSTDRGDAPAVCRRLMADAWATWPPNSCFASKFRANGKKSTLWFRGILFLHSPSVRTNCVELFA